MKFSEVPHSDIVHAYSEGISARALSKKYGCTIKLIQKVVMANGVKVRGKADAGVLKRVVIDYDSVCADYLSGMSLESVAAKYSSSSATIRSILSRSTVKSRSLEEVGAARRIKIDEDALVEKYVSGVSSNDIAKELNISNSSVINVLKRKGVARRDISTARKVFYEKNGKPDISYLHTDAMREKLRGPRPSMRGDKNPNFSGKGMYSPDDGAWLNLDGRGYLRRRLPEHPLSSKDGFVLEHVYQAAKIHGVEFLIGKVIHHKNREKIDNRIENLDVLSPREHALEHYNERVAAGLRSTKKS